ncbi:hypothetical protein COO91_02896 [Nostoc flagelliforme CCNUN1]|uniref:Uncharacterized protein n=2 Tax=Nostoc flagelliforme TaxID=1306274 RepID=A0A2K8SNH8_9NOSO|nr:hypothetical protein COO91_02896 [Nostoc flagelliforme CCNUN1]
MLSMPAAGGAIACYTKALDFRNGKSFRIVTQEGYLARFSISTIPRPEIYFWANSQSPLKWTVIFYP